MSTMCSSTLGPAIIPSLVTCPSRKVGMPLTLGCVASGAWCTRGAAPPSRGGLQLGPVDALDGSPTQQHRLEPLGVVHPPTRLHIRLSEQVEAARVEAQARRDAY